MSGNGKQNSLESQLNAALASIGKVVWTRRPEILLCPNIPKPMHGLAPRTVLGRTWWDKVRMAAYASTDYHCIACGVPKHKAKMVKHLEGHEVYTIDYPLGRMEYVETVPLCNFCHSGIHSGRLRWLVRNGTMTQRQVNEIMSHYEHIITESGLKRPEPYEGFAADWSDWRLVIEGREYPSLFKSATEYETLYNFNYKE